MARAGKELGHAIKTLNDMLLPTFAQKIQDQLRKQKGYLFLGPLKLRLLRGISGDGTTLQAYAEGTKLKRKKEGLNTTPTTLRFTGAWYKSMYVHFGLSGKLHVFEIKNKDGPASENGGKTIEEKTKYLKRKYGASILTLNEKEQKNIATEIEEVFLTKLNGLGDIKITL